MSDLGWRVSAQTTGALSAAQREFVANSTYGATFSTPAVGVAHWLAANPPSEAEKNAAIVLGMDLNAIPAHWRWTDLGLLASDMDSTLITCECIDEIADFAGVKARVSEITERAMRGEIAFSHALRERVALLAGVPERVLAQVFDERVQLSPGAKALVDQAHAVGATTLLVSGGFTYFTHRLQMQLGLTETLANALGVHDGALTGKVESAIVDGEAKARVVAELKSDLPAGKLTVAMGDGANDIPMMAVADLSVAYRAKPAVQRVASVAFNVCGLDAVRQLFP